MIDIELHASTYATAYGDGDEAKENRLHHAYMAGYRGDWDRDHPLDSYLPDAEAHAYAAGQRARLRGEA